MFSKVIDCISGKTRRLQEEERKRERDARSERLRQTLDGLGECLSAILFPRCPVCNYIVNERGDICLSCAVKILDGKENNMPKTVNEPIWCPGCGGAHFSSNPSIIQLHSDFACEFRWDDGKWVPADLNKLDGLEEDYV